MIVVQIAVLKEMDAKGPFVSLVMGVVVLKDVVVIVAFALTMELVPMVSTTAVFLVFQHCLHVSDQECTG